MRKMKIILIAFCRLPHFQRERDERRAHLRAVELGVELQKRTRQNVERTSCAGIVRVLVLMRKDHCAHSLDLGRRTAERGSELRLGHGAPIGVGRADHAYVVQKIAERGLVPAIPSWNDQSHAGAVR